MKGYEYEMKLKLQVVSFINNLKYCLCMLSCYRLDTYMNLSGMHVTRRFSDICVVFGGLLVTIYYWVDVQVQVQVQVQPID